MGYRVGLSSLSLSHGGLASALLHAEESVLGQVAVQLLSSTVRLTSSREHGPQGRLAQVGKRGVLL